MNLLVLLKFGTPVLVMGMLLFLERINAKLNSIQEDVHEIKGGITWSDTCNAIHVEVNRRFERKFDLLKKTTDSMKMPFKLQAV